jgi:hypothetical protein
MTFTLINFEKKILRFLLGQKIVDWIPVYLLRLFAWLGIGILILLFYCFFVFVDYIIHPSVLLAPIRWRLRDVIVKEFDTEQLLGEWEIEQPYPNILGNFDVKGWQKTRLIFYKGGDCVLVKPTRDIMLTEICYDSPETVEAKKKAIGHELRGKYELPHKDEIYLRIADHEMLMAFRIDCPPYHNYLIVKQVPTGSNREKYRLIMNCTMPTYKNYSDGIIWKQCENSENK